MPAVRPLPYRKSARRGAALVELAICTPLVLLLTMGTIEACSILHFRQSLKIAAFEACRVGLVPKSTSANVLQQVREILDDRQIVDYEVELEPPEPAMLQSGEFLRVVVSAPCRGNLVLQGWFADGKRYSGQVEMLRDY